MAEVRIRTIAGRNAASPGLGGISTRYGAKDTEPTGKEDARFHAETARTSDIKAAYAKEIASLKNEIAMLKDCFDYT